MREECRTVPRNLLLFSSVLVGAPGVIPPVRVGTMHAKYQGLVFGREYSCELAIENLGVSWVFGRYNILVISYKEHHAYKYKDLIDIFLEKQSDKKTIRVSYFVWCFLWDPDEDLWSKY